MDGIIKIRQEEELIDEFMADKRRLEYESSVSKIKLVADRMKKIANRIEHLKGWPDDRRIFWGLESASWDIRVEDECKEFVKKQLAGVKGSTLELGCGSTPCADGVYLDISFLMLNSIKKDNGKVVADIENGLPFKDGLFDNVVLVFVANYVKNLDKLFSEIKRVLKNKGKVRVVQSAMPVNSYHIIVEEHKQKGFKYRLVKVMSKYFKAKVQKKKFMKRTYLFVEGATLSC